MVRGFVRNVEFYFFFGFIKLEFLFLKDFWVIGRYNKVYEILFMKMEF